MDLAAERAYPTPYANSSLLPLLVMSLASQRISPEPATTFKEEYDYIIVGAGSAGSVVASRLSDEACVSVLLLEAGKAPPYLDDIPALARYFWFTDIDWQYKTVPQKHTGNGLVNKQVIWASGKGLGGSSLLNAMLYVRGNKKNYDDWAKQGAEGWSYEDVLPYFIKAEDNQDPYFVADGYHGVGGPLTVEQSGYHSEIKDPISEAAQQLGYEFVDPNGARQTGFYDYQATLRNEQRCSTAKAYLVPVENRTNLDILPNAYVRKILIEGNRTTGVSFDFGNNTHTVKARREVILSAGTTNTAQLLMLSGIGPREHLEKFNIPVKVDLPVGDNLQDHCAVIFPYHINEEIPNVTQKLEDTENVMEYINNRTGPLSSAEFVTYLAFLNSHSFHPKVDFPNYQLYFQEITKELAKYQVGLKPEVYKQVFEPYENGNMLTCVAQMLQPKSRGTVRLQSTNPYDPPLIDPNYLQDPTDLQNLVEGLKTCERIVTSEPMKRIGAQPFQTKFPGCEQFYGNEDSYFACLARSVVLTLNHQVSTTKMGDPEDPTTVVDPKLRVKNVQGLRVVDASVMPIIPSGNTNVPTIMVAEKASDIIKQTIHCPS